MEVWKLLLVLCVLALFEATEARRRSKGKCYGLYTCQKSTTPRGSRKCVCITMDQLCDGRPDCPNKDDEIGCPCPKLSNPLNGNVNTSDGLEVTKVATYTCNMGYRLDGVSMRTCLSNSKWSGVVPSCTKTDIDECALKTDNCDCNAACINTVGSFTCTCNAGYEGDGNTCSDIDECMTGQNNCGPNSICTNTPGSFTCTCIFGYTHSDGSVCEECDPCNVLDGEVLCLVPSGETKCVSTCDDTIECTNPEDEMPLSTCPTMPCPAGEIMCEIMGSNGRLGCADVCDKVQQCQQFDEDLGFDGSGDGKEDLCGLLLEGCDKEQRLCFLFPKGSITPCCICRENRLSSTLDSRCKVPLVK